MFLLTINVLSTYHTGPCYDYWARESESFSRLLADVADEKFYTDVLSWGVRYLIFVRGSTRSLEAGGDFIMLDWWTGLWGFLYWHNKTHLGRIARDKLEPILNPLL